MARVRKQIYELTLADLNEHPIWEFALDEEGALGQDEATVRPYTEDSPNEPDSTLIVRADFVPADGTRLRGYLHAQPNSNTGVASVQPAIVTNAGQIHFWHGVVPPSRKEIDVALQKLGRLAEKVFPLRFASEDGRVSGSLAGFMFLDRGSWTEQSTV